MIRAQNISGSGSGLANWTSARSEQHFASSSYWMRLMGWTTWVFRRETDLRNFLVIEEVNTASESISSGGSVFGGAQQVGEEVEIVGYH